MRLCVCLLMAMAGLSHAAAVTFTPREMFRIPFGKSRDTLRAKIAEDNLLIPSDFTMDTAGHIYIYDSNNHRIARFSATGQYEMGVQYPATARQIFAHADSRQNLWILISDPFQGMYYGVYDPHGKSLRSAVFSKFNRYRLHLDDDATLHLILSADMDPTATQTYILDEDTLLLKKEKIAPPPENHHKVRRNERVYFIDQVPDGSKEDARHVNRVTDESHRGVANIKGSVIYVNDQGEVYTRVGEREIDVFDIGGSLLGKIQLQGLSSACKSIRFDAEGNVYELDGIPDQEGHYTAAMPGLRLIRWERQ